MTDDVEARLRASLTPEQRDRLDDVLRKAVKRRPGPLPEFSLARVPRFDSSLPPLPGRPVDPILVEAVAKASRAASQSLDRAVLGQLDAVATSSPWSDPTHDVMADVRAALRTIENAKRTVVVHTSAQHTITQGLADWPLVTVVASSLVPEGTAYVLAAGTMRLEPDGRLMSVVDGEPVTLDPRAVVKVTDAS